MLPTDARQALLEARWRIDQILLVQTPARERMRLRHELEAILIAEREAELERWREAVESE